MSDNIRMSDTFTGKVKRDLYDGESVLADNVYFELIDDDQLDAMALAINSHDKLTDRVAELEAALRGLMDSPHIRLARHMFIEASESDIDIAIKALQVES